MPSKASLILCALALALPHAARAEDRRPLEGRRPLRHPRRGRPADQPRRRRRGLHGANPRPGEGQGRTPTSTGFPWPGARRSGSPRAPSRRPARASAPTAADRVPLRPRGQEDPGLPAAGRGGRSGEADRLQGRGVRPRVVARRGAARAGGERPGSGREAGGRSEGRGRRQEDAQADRPAAGSSSSATRRASSATFTPTSTSSTWPRRPRPRSRAGPSTIRTPSGRPTARRSPSSATGPPSPTRTATPTSSSWRRARMPPSAPSPPPPRKRSPRPSAPTASSWPMSKAAIPPTCGTPPTTSRSCPSRAERAGRSRRSLDRNPLGTPRFSPDGRSILFLVEDRGNVHLARVPVAGGAVEKIVTGDRVLSSLELGAKGEMVVVESQSNLPKEVSRVTPTGLERLSHVNDAVLKGIKLAPVSRHVAKSADGTEIDYFLIRPPDAPAGAKLPAILRHPRRAGVAVPVRVELRVADPRGPRLPRGLGQPPRLVGPRPRLQPGAVGRLGRQGPRGRDGGRGRGGRDGSGRSRPAGGRGLELRRHPHRLDDLPVDALQGRDLGRGDRERVRGLRHRPLPVRVRGGARASLEEHGRPGRSCPSRFSRPTRSRPRPSSCAARSTGTCRSSTRSRCTRRSAGWACPPSSWSIPGESHGIKVPSYQKDGTSGTWPGTTAT